MKKVKSVIWINANQDTENSYTKIAYFGSLKIAAIRVETKRAYTYVKCKILFPISEKSQFPVSYSTQSEAQEAVEYFWDRLIHEVS